jgi:hypothetical protein
MIVDVALEQSLRTLKLSGMLQTLEARLAQARALAGLAWAGMWWRWRATAAAPGPAPGSGSGSVVTVPCLVGLSARQAHDVALDALVLAVDHRRRTRRRTGGVARQKPPAGQRVSTGTPVRIWVDEADPPESGPPDGNDDHGNGDGGGGGGGGGGFGPRFPWRPGPRLSSGVK